LSDTTAWHRPKVAPVRSHRGNFLPIPSPLLHRCNTLRAFEGHAGVHRLKFTSHRLKIIFRKQYSGM